MIELRMENNQALDLYPDTSISLEINNPLLSRDLIPGSFSMPFSLPGSPRNCRLLNFAHRLDVAQRVVGNRGRKYPVTLFVLGIAYKSGELIVRKAGPAGFQANFQTDISLLSDKFSTLTLQTLSHQSIDINRLADIDASQAFTNVYYDNYYTSYTPESVASWQIEATGQKYIKYSLQGKETEVPETFIVKVNGVSYHNDNIELYSRLSGAVFLVTAQVENITGRVLREGNDAYWTLLFYTTNGDINQAMDISFEGLDLEVMASWQQVYLPAVEDYINAQFKDNTVAGDAFVLPTFLNNKLLKGGDDEASRRNAFGLHNYYNGAKFLLQYATSGVPPSGVPPSGVPPSGVPPSAPLHAARVYGLVPMFSLQYVLDQIERDTGVLITGVLRDHEYLQKLIFYNDHALNTYTQNNIPGISAQIKPGEHLADMKLSELFMELGKMFCLSFDYDQNANQLKTIHLPSLLTSNPVGGTPPAISGKTNPLYEKDIEEHQGVTFSFSLPDDEKALFEKKNALIPDSAGNAIGSRPGQNLSPLIFGQGKDKISTKFSTLFTEKINQDLATFVDNILTTLRIDSKMPISDMEGTLSDEAGNRVAGRPDARLLYYAGLQPDKNGQLYPYATSDSTNYQDEVLTEYVLQWEGVFSQNIGKDLFQKWWKPWYEYEQSSQLLSITTYLNIADMLKHSHGQHYQISFVQGNRRFFFSKLKFSVSMKNGLQAQNIEAQSIENFSASHNG